MSAAPVIVQRLELAGGSPRTLAISANGQVVAAGGGVAVDPMDRVFGLDPRAYLWDAESGELRHAIVTPHPSSSRSSSVLVALLPDARRLLTSGDDGLIIEWDIESGRERRRFGGAGAVSALSLSDDGRVLLTGGSFEDARLRVWDVDAGQLVATLEGAHDWSVSALALAGARVVSASSGALKGLRMHDLSTGRELQHFGASAGHISALSLSPGADRVLSGGFSKLARVWHSATGKALATLKGRRDSSGVALHPDGRALTCSDGALCDWDVGSGTLLHEARVECSAPLALSRDGRRAVTLGPSALLLWATA